MPKKIHTSEELTHITLVERYLKNGDLVTHKRCMGLIEEHIVSGRDGQCYCGTATHDTRKLAKHPSGHGSTGWANDIGAINVTHINRVPVAAIEFLATAPAAA